MKHKCFTLMLEVKTFCSKKAFSDYSHGQPTVPVSANLSISKNENNGTFTIVAKNLKGLEGYKELKFHFVTCEWNE